MINTKLALLLIVTALIAIIIIALFFLNKPEPTVETIEPFVPPEEIIIIPQWGLDPIGK